MKTFEDNFLENPIIIFKNHFTNILFCVILNVRIS